MRCPYYRGKGLHYPRFFIQPSDWVQRGRAVGAVKHDGCEENFKSLRESLCGSETVKRASQL